MAEAAAEDSEFAAACAFVRASSGKLENKDLLYFYARFKLAKEGQCTAPKPAFYQLTEKSKWQAWMDLGSLEGMEAKLQYIQRLDALFPEWRGEEAKDPSASGWVSVSCPRPPQDSVLDKDKTLWDHAKEGSLDSLVLALGEEADYGVRDEQGLSLLHWASDRGHTNIAEFLISKHCSLVNTKDHEGQTPLHYASSCGHVDMVRLLLQHGADPNARDLDGFSPNTSDIDKNVKEIFDEYSN